MTLKMGQLFKNLWGDNEFIYTPYAHEDILFWEFFTFGNFKITINSEINVRRYSILSYLCLDYLRIILFLFFSLRQVFRGVPNKNVLR